MGQMTAFIRLPVLILAVAAGFAPGRLPKDLSKLKYPARGEYELEILAVEYKRPAASAAKAPPAGGAAPAKVN